MSSENKQKLLDAINKEFVKKNKAIALGCLFSAVLLVIISVLVKTYYFSLIGIPFLFVALFAFNNSKKYSDSKNIEQIIFSEEICTLKASELSTTGNIRYLVFSNDLRYDISFSEASLYNEAFEGQHFLMASDRKKRSILTLIPLSKEKETNASQSSAATPVISDETLPGLTVSLKNMMDLSNRPIIVCNLLHRVCYLNKAAQNQFSAAEKTFPEGTTLLEYISSEKMLTIQKALLEFSENSDNNKVAGWQEEDGQQVDLYALRDNNSHLCGYYLQ